MTATDNGVAIGLNFDPTTNEVIGTVAVPAGGSGDLVYTLALDDQYGMTSVTDPTVTLKPRDNIAVGDPAMDTLIGTSTTSAYPLSAAIDTLAIFPTTFAGASVTITHLGPGTSTLSDDPQGGPHKTLGATGDISDGWHTFEFRYDDGCQNSTVIQTFCANTAPYLTGNVIALELDIG